MSKVFTDRMNSYGLLIHEGEWQQAIRAMVNDGMDYENVMWLCDKINFYPSNDFCKYAKDIIAAGKNKEALDGFFAKNI